MAGTYSQVYIQVVFAVKGRSNLILPEWKPELNRYISGIITGKKQKSIIVNGGTDHTHVLFGLQPSMAVSDLVRDIKNNSTNFINDKKLAKGKFSWQGGFGAFSYSRSQLDRVYNYILNQDEHHKKKTFKEEYFKLLKLFDIPFEEKYLFEWIE